MMDNAPSAPAPSGMTAEQASSSRTQLLADPDFRSKAASGGAAWAQLTALNATIAAGKDADAAEAARAGPAPPQGVGEPHDDPEAPVGFYDPPASPGQYQLPDAQATGLHVDAQADMEFRTAMHAAGVDNDMASTLYGIAMHQVQQDLSPVTIATEYAKAEGQLRQKWGREFDARLALVNGEGKRLFEALPKSVTQGMSYREFALVSGLANSRIAVEQLYRRAKSRARA